MKTQHQNKTIPRHRRRTPIKSAFALLLALSLGGTLTSIRAADVDSLPGMGPQPVEYFYTGKPYDADTESYAFLYRNYDPEINRWTSVDPSGFPDGANNQIYAPNPTSAIDLFGLAEQTLIYNGQYTDEKTQHQELFISYQISLSNGQQTTGTLSASVQNVGATFAQQYSNYVSHSATANNWTDIGSPNTVRNSGKAPGQISSSDVSVPQGWAFDSWVGSPIIDPTAVIFGPTVIGPSPGTPHLRDLYWFEQTTYSMSYKVVE